MGKKLLICVSAFSFVTFGSGKTCACPCQDPVAGLSVEGAVWRPYDGYYVGCAGTSLSFDATGSYDPDCEDCSECGGTSMLDGISKFEWDWNNDGSYDYSESPGDGIATHTYSSPGTYFVKLKVHDDDDDCCCSGSGCSDRTDTLTIEVRIVLVQIAEFDRVPPGVSKSVTVTVSPSGAWVCLDVIRTGGTSGSATVSPTCISGGTTAVTVTGGDQTSPGNAGNMSLRAGVALDCICDTEAFTVCAHPDDFKATFCDALAPSSTFHGLQVSNYVWISDSGSTSHLDQCLLDESFSGGHGATPPFYNVGLPTPRRPVAMSGGSIRDEQGWLKSQVHGYPPGGEAGWNQKIFFTCDRCNESDTLTDNTTTFTVYGNLEPAGTWSIKTNVSMSCPDPPYACYINEYLGE